MAAARERAAYRYREDRIAIPLIILLIILLYLLSRCASDPQRDGIALPDMAPLGTVSISSTSESAEDPSADGQLTAGGTPLIPLSEAAAADGSLTGYVGEEAIADGVSVLSVPADEGFWVGTGDNDRVWVQLIGVGESPYTVLPGDTVLFTGEVVAHGADFPGSVCVGTNQGSDLLAAQGAHIEVPMDELTLRG